MLSEAFMVGNSVFHRLDPRQRLIFTLLFSIIIAVSQRFSTLFTATFFSFFFIHFSQIPLRDVAKRIIIINVFNLILVLLLPLTYDGGAILHTGTFAINKEGLLLALRITLKSNAIILVFVALVATMSIATLGKSLNRLRVPDKLIYLLLIAYRYVFVLEQEYNRLLTAMRARGFKPASNIHTYRSYAYLFAMLLVKALARADRVYQSMLCRGFRSRFYCLEVFSFSRIDLLWAPLFLLILLLLCSLEWLTTTILL